MSSAHTISMLIATVSAAVLPAAAQRDTLPIGRWRGEITPTGQLPSSAPPVSTSAPK